MEIKRTSNSLTIVGHAEKLEDCKAITAGCYALSAVQGVTTRKLESGIADFSWETGNVTADAVADTIGMKTPALFAPVISSGAFKIVRLPTGVSIRGENADYHAMVTMSSVLIPTDVSIGDATVIAFFDSNGNKLYLNKDITLICKNPNDLYYDICQDSAGNSIKIYCAGNLTPVEIEVYTMEEIDMIDSGSTGGGTTASGTDITIGNTTFSGVQGVSCNGTAVSTVTIDGTAYSV